MRILAFALFILAFLSSDSLFVAQLAQRLACPVHKKFGFRLMDPCLHGETLWWT